jgi:hypothetical protein
VASARSTLKSVIRASEAAVTDDYTAVLREYAEKRGWPSDIVKKIKMSYDHNLHKITYPAEIQEVIDSLQHGTPENNFDDKNDALMFFTLERNYKR